MGSASPQSTLNALTARDRVPSGRNGREQVEVSETIFAPASGVGPAGIAVIRISGPVAGAALRRLTGVVDPPPRRAMRVRIRDDQGETIDIGLALWFPRPASFTGEDVVELHVHGGRAVVAGVLEALAAVEALRPAEPGEFTRRAFENDKLDLTAAEAIADLVNAETKAQRRQAVRQMQGDLGRLYDGWRERLIRLLAHQEALIDFADEDLPPETEERVRAEVAPLAAELTRHLADDRRGERLREGIRIAIVGPPNAGKSSLLNVLARREAAIVAASPGTTRDVIEVHLDLAGYPVLLADTAGLREATEAIEQEGVRRSLRTAEEADLKLVVFDGAAGPGIDAAAAALVDADSIVVVNKSDIAHLEAPVVVKGHEAIPISALTGAGLAALLHRVEAEVGRRWGLSGGIALTRVRHRQALERCAGSLTRIARQGGEAMMAETVAEDLRLAARELGRITGRVDVEEILGVIFQDFCIGK
jgi:tRNA modification GTPase